MQFMGLKSDYTYIRTALGHDHARCDAPLVKAAFCICKNLVNDAVSLVFHDT